MQQLPKRNYFWTSKTANAEAKADEAVAEPIAETKSIFDTAEFSAEGANPAVSKAIFSQQTPWLDSNDALLSLQSVVPKDMHNLTQGVATHGLWEYVAYLDDLFFNFWMQTSQFHGIGLGYGLMLTTLVTRLFLAPVVINS